MTYVWVVKKGPTVLGIFQLFSEACKSVRMTDRFNGMPTNIVVHQNHVDQSVEFTDGTVIFLMEIHKTARVFTH